MTSKTFYIETFGCQMNAHDSEKVIGTLVSQGYTLEQAKRKASERLNQVRKEAIQRRRSSLRIVRDAPPDKQ